MSKIVIGVDLGGTKMLAATVDQTGNILTNDRSKTQPADGPGAVIERLATLCEAVAAAAGRSMKDVEAVCIGVPGGINEETGVVDIAPNLAWENVPLGPTLAKRLGTRVFLDNDVRVAVQGEYAYGAGRGTRTMLGVYVGTGVGGGLIIDGKLHEGNRGVAGEVGHMIIDPHGPKAKRGNRGSLESFASRTAMERDVRALIDSGKKSVITKLLKKKNRTRLTSSIIEEALDEKDPVMTKVFANAQYYLGLGLANVANLLDPELIVIGGGIAERMGERFVAPARAIAYEHFLVKRDADHVRIVATELKERAAPLGAALVARRRLAKPVTPIAVSQLLDRA
jgi:glucokinase